MTLGPQLDTLEASGLIRLAAARPELLYLFRHWLVQDAAYTSLLKQERRELHRLVGESLEKLYPEHPAEQAAELAVHFERAEMPDRAVHYLIAAGHYALERYAIQEARTFFDRAASLVPADGDAPDQLRARVEIALGRIKAGFSAKLFDEEIAIVEAVVPDAEKLGDQQLLLDTYLWVALLRQQRGERYETSPEMHRALDRATEVGEALGDPSASAMPLAFIGMSQVRDGELRAGTETLERAIPLLEQRRAFIGASMAIATLSLGYARMGDFARAREASDRSIALAEGGDPIARLDAQIVKAMLESMSGNLDQAHEIAQQCVRQADALGSPSCAVFSRFVLGDVQLQRGQPELAKPTLERGDILAFGSAFVRPMIEGWLGSAQAELGDVAGARTAWEAAVREAVAGGDRFTEAAVRLRRATTLAQQANPPWAEIAADLEVSVAVFEAAEARPFLANALGLYGPALLKLGRADEGRAQLERATQVRESMGMKAKAETIGSEARPDMTSDTSRPQRAAG
jgi:tetratricopeptide (TPR) repeat protein